MHRTLWRAFPDHDPGRVLFRVDTDRRGGSPIVLVQSDHRPAWERVEEHAPHYLLAAPEPPKELRLSFLVGQRLRFRLRANPTKKVGSLLKCSRLAGAGSSDRSTKNGRRVALLREEEQVAYLLHKGEQGGFRVPGQWVEQDDCKWPNFRVDVVAEGWVRFGKDGHADGRFYAVRFDGVLEVTNPEQFRQTLADGIGSAKCFGFGLLSVAPCKE
jgi:CRISPR system Cascade subunit CasE